MKNRRILVRRRQDRLALALALVSILGLYATYTNACNGAKDTITRSELPEYSPPAPTGSAGAPQTITPTEGEQPPEPKAVEVACTGNPVVCTFTNNSNAGRPVHAVCTPKGVVWHPGTSSDWGRWDGWADAKGGTAEVTPYEACSKVSGLDRCKGDHRGVQIDLTYGTSWTHVGQWGLNGGPLVWPPNEEYCQCEPHEWEVVSRGEPVPVGDWGSCDQFLLEADHEQTCYQCRATEATVVESNGCEQRERTVYSYERRETECPPPAPCYYEVDCSVRASSNVACQLLKKARCEAQPPFGPAGEWANWFGQGEGHEQCRVAFPGWSNDHFQLNPGQSAEGCLDKQD